MRRYFLICVSVTFFVASYAWMNGYFQPSPIAEGILDEDLRVAYLDYESTMKQERTPLLFTDNSSANNCRAYLELLTKNEVLGTTVNSIIQSEYNVCDELKILAHSKKYTGKIDKAQIGRDLLYKLDLESFTNSIRPKIAWERDQGHRIFRLNTLFPTESFAESAVAGYESDDWFLSMYVVAVVNINDNLLQDWIVSFVDDAKQATYVDYSTLIIYDAEGSETLKAHRFNKELLQRLSNEH